MSNWRKKQQQQKELWIRKNISNASDLNPNIELTAPKNPLKWIQSIVHHYMTSEGCYPLTWSLNEFRWEKQQGILTLGCHFPTHLRGAEYIECVERAWRDPKETTLTLLAWHPGTSGWVAEGQISGFFRASPLGAKVHLAQKLKSIHPLCSKLTWVRSACAWKCLCFKFGFFQVTEGIGQGSNSSRELCDVEADQM